MIDFKLVTAEHGTRAISVDINSAEDAFERLKCQANAFKQWYIISRQKGSSWSYAAGDYDFYELEFMETMMLVASQHNTHNVPRE